MLNNSAQPNGSCDAQIQLCCWRWCYFHATLLLRCVFYSCDGRCFALSLDSHICVCSLISYKYDREWSSIPFIPHFVGTFHSCTRTTLSQCLCVSVFGELKTCLWFHIFSSIFRKLNFRILSSLYHPNERFISQAHNINNNTEYSSKWAIFAKSSSRVVSINIYSKKWNHGNDDSFNRFASWEDFYNSL